jgi:hypothetical protein
MPRLCKSGFRALDAGAHDAQRGNTGVDDAWGGDIDTNGHRHASTCLACSHTRDQRVYTHATERSLLRGKRSHDFASSALLSDFVPSRQPELRDGSCQHEIRKPRLLKSKSSWTGIGPEQRRVSQCTKLLSHPLNGDIGISNADAYLLTPSLTDT